MSKETDKRWKGFVIDWAEISDMDPIDYELKALNQQQVAILLALLQYQKWQTRWLNLELSNDELQAYIGDIEYRLMQNEETMSIDYDAWYQANKAAIYDALNDVAKQIVSGRTTNISVGSDGAVSDPTSGLPDEELPTDDPETPFDEAEAARSGGASAVRIGINTIWSNLNTWYNAALPLATSQYRLKQIYNLNEAEADSLVSQYYSDRQQAQPYVTSFASTLDAYLYCKSVTVQTIAEWIYEVHTANQQAQASFIVPALTTEQLNTWFAEGSKVPSGDYIAYSCVPIDPEEWILDAAYLPTAVYKTGAQITKVNHRTLVEVSGKVFHPSDGSYQDFYYHVAANGTKTFLGTASSQGSIQFNNPAKPTQAKLPFRPDGIYASTIETTQADLYEFRRVISADKIAAGSTGFAIKITDLGEVIS